MAYSIAGALLPIAITFLLGFIGAWRGDFRREDASVLNRLVLTYALPLMLFAGTMGTSRANLGHDVPLVTALCSAIVGMYAVVFLASRLVFAAATNTSALIALAASAPAVPFMGPAILGHFFGQTSAIPIALASLVINLTVVPVTLLFLSLNPVSGSRHGEDRAAQNRLCVAPRETVLSVITGKLEETVRQPLVWAPVVAFVVVLIDVPVPSLLLDALSLLGHATEGVSLFAAGIVLASNKVTASWPVMLLVLLKNVAEPALILGGLRWLGFGDPLLSEAVLTMAIPVMPIVAMLALQYRVGEALAASSLFFSVIGSVITLAVFILVTN
jgi:malonate transporter and related proteins